MRGKLVTSLRKGGQAHGEFVTTKTSCEGGGGRLICYDTMIFAAHEAKGLR